MKKIRNILIFLLTLAILAGAVPFAFSSYSDNILVNSDSESYADGTVYGIDCETGRVLMMAEGSDNVYLTSYSASKLACFDGLLYVAEGKKLHTIDVKSKKDTVVFEHTGYITCFTLTRGISYFLSRGSIYTLDENGKAELFRLSGVISDFWLDDINNLSYTTDGDFIYTVNTVTGKESAKANSISSLEDIIIPSSGGQKSNNSSTDVGIGNLRSKFPAGKYWNHRGMSSNNSNGYTSTPCDHNTYGSSYCNSCNGAIQCAGYAVKCGYDIFGSYANSSWQRNTSSSSINNVKAGDIIRYRNDEHSIFVTGVSGNTIYFTDANWGRQCGIRWDATISKSTVKSSFTYLRVAPYEAPGGSSPSNPNIYTVTFNANGGSVSPSSFRIYEGNALGELPVPTRTGYTFDGWYTSSSGGSRVTSSTVCNSNITLYAHWTIITYNVSFDANGGSSGSLPSSFTIEYGDSKTIGRQKPLRTGYTFSNWNTSPDGSGTSYESGGKYQGYSSAVLYAIWEANTYTVSLKPNDGSVSPSSITVTYGSPYGELPVPTRLNYYFGGWYLDTSLKNPVTSDTIVATAKAHSLYAKWIEKDIFTVYYNSNGGENAPVSQQKKKNVSLTLSSTIPRRTGYTFEGWYTSADGTGRYYAPGGTYTDNSDIVLYAKWEPLKFTISFDANSGTGAPASQIKEYDTVLTLTTEVPEKTGYVCTSWNTKANGTGTTYYPGGRYSEECSATLYAQWEERAYIISYNPQGGTGAPASQKKYHFSTSSVTLSTSKPVRTGYDFIEWNTKSDGSGESYNPGDIYDKNKDLSLFAIWEAKQFTVYFDAGAGIENPSPITVTYDSPYGTLPSVSKTGYSFAGWYYPNTGGSRINATDEVKITSDSTFYARWIANTYTVFFNTGTPELTADSIRVTYDSTYGALPDISRTGYDFEGWFTEAEGGREVKSTDSVKITTSITLYAHWKAQTFTVTFNPGFSGGSVTEKVIAYDSVYGNMPEPSRRGYIFAGWFTAPADGRRITPDTVMKTAENHTLYGLWAEDVYTLTFDADGGSCETRFIHIKSGETAGELPVPQKEGFTFEGWFTPDNALFSSGSAVSGNMTLTAKWSGNRYSLTFDPGEGTCDTAAKEVTYSSLVGSLPEAYKEGSVFLGWFNEQGEEVTEETIYTYLSGTALTAVYAEVVSGSVAFTAGSETVAVIPYSDEITKPAIPAKDGFTGSWGNYEEISGGYLCRAVYTPGEFEISYIFPGRTVKQQYPAGGKIIPPEIPAKPDYMFTGWSGELPAAMPANNIELTAVYIPKEYTAKFIADSELIDAVPYTVESESVAEPEVPEKPGYTYSWENYTLKSGGTVIFAMRTLNEYEIVFKANQKIVGRAVYTVETISVTEPEIPAENGYTGSWPSYTFTPGGLTVNAVYTPNTYTATFKADGKTVGTVKYKYGAKSVKEPDIPAKTGYTAAWADYTLSYEDLTVNAVYTPITYTATFVADGVVVAKVPFTVESTSINEPYVPIRSNGKSGEWSSYAIVASDITINAVYEDIPKIHIAGYINSRTENYRTTITFKAVAEDAPNGSEIRWFVDNTDCGIGYDDKYFTVHQAKKTFTVRADLYCNDGTVIQSKTEEVVIKKNIILVIKAFFQNLFGKLPVVYQ